MCPPYPGISDWPKARARCFRFRELGHSTTQINSTSRIWGYQRSSKNPYILEVQFIVRWWASVSLDIDSDRRRLPEYLIFMLLDDVGSLVMVSGGTAVFVVLGGDA